MLRAFLFSTQVLAHIECVNETMAVKMKNVLKFESDVSQFFQNAECHSVSAFANMVIPKQKEEEIKKIMYMGRRLSSCTTCTPENEEDVRAVVDRANNDNETQYEMKLNSDVGFTSGIECFSSGRSRGDSAIKIIGSKISITGRSEENKTKLMRSTSSDFRMFWIEGGANVQLKYLHISGGGRQVSLFEMILSTL